MVPSLSISIGGPPFVLFSAAMSRPHFQVALSRTWGNVKLKSSLLLRPAAILSLFISPYSRAGLRKEFNDTTDHFGGRREKTYNAITVIALHSMTV